MSTLARTTSLAAILVTLVTVGPSVASAGPDDGSTDDLAVVTTTTDPQPVDPQLTGAGRCDGLDHDLLDVDLDDTGELTFVYAGDDYATCDEVMVVTSYASAGPEVDNHDDPVVDEVVFQVAELEAAGSDGVTVAVELDECWAGVQVLRDGDTFVFDDVIGDGCELEISTSFTGDPFPTEVHVVQQTGAIEPPYLLDHDADETTLLTGLPNGTWYVKIYDGALAASTIAVDGGAPLVTHIVHGIADGSVVDIVHPQPGRRPRSVSWWQAR